VGRHLHFEPGSFYRVDDRTGFPQRAGRTRKEWTGLIVDESVWEPRQPQDLVKGVPDLQFVPEPRPLAPNVFVGPIYFDLSADAAVDATIIPLEETRRITVGDPFGVMLDSGVIFQTTVASIGAGFVVLADPLPASAASGNSAIDFAPGTGMGVAPTPPVATPDLDFSMAPNSQYLGMV
jgi:hypothetical protein